MTIAVLAAFGVSVRAQQANIIYPVIHDDHSATFTVYAPNAKEVNISGDWMPFEGWVPGPAGYETSQESYPVLYLQHGAPGEGVRGYYKPQFMVPGTMDGASEETFMDIDGTLMQLMENGYELYWIGIGKNWRTCLSEFVPLLFN